MTSESRRDLKGSIEVFSIFDFRLLIGRIANRINKSDNQQSKIKNRQ